MDGRSNSRAESGGGDEALMEGVRRREPQALAALMERHQSRLAALALRISGDAAEARDIVQEVFIRLWEDPDAWSPRAQLSTFLYRVTLNRALDFRRKLKRWVRLAPESAEAEPDEPPDETPAADVDLERAERSRRLARAMAALPARPRAALHLRYYEGLAVGEVAKVLGVSVKSAESLLFRAKVQLRRHLAAEGDW